MTEADIPLRAEDDETAFHVTFEKMSPAAIEAARRATTMLWPPGKEVVLADDAEADIPLRDQIAEIVSTVCEKQFGMGCVWTDPTPAAAFPEIAAEVHAGDCDALADALLERFEITPRGSLPVNEEPE